MAEPLEILNSKGELIGVVGVPSEIKALTPPFRILGSDVPCQYKANIIFTAPNGQIVVIRDDEQPITLKPRNGEPNTRSTDERVRELVDLDDSVFESIIGYCQSRDNQNRYQARWRKAEIVFAWLLDHRKELFPACKPSEEEVK